MPRLAIVGHCTIDDVHHVEGRVSAGTFGGAAAYAALGASMAGGEVSLVSVVGEDYPVERLSTVLTVAGRVDAQAVRTVPGRSIHVEVRYAADGTRRSEIESWDRLELLLPTPDELDLDALAGALVLLAQAPVSQQTALAAALEALAPRAAAVALDTELHYLDTADRRSALLALAARVDLFLPSIEHLQLLLESDSRDPADHLPELRSLGCPLVVVKQGACGSTVVDTRSGKLLHVPALAGLRVDDPTGAGDAYNGGFLAARARGADPCEAAVAATVSASFVVESSAAAAPAHFTEPLARERAAILRARVESTPQSQSREPAGRAH